MAALASLALCACAYDMDGTEDLSSWEIYRANHLIEGAQDSGFVIEGDIIVGEDTLRAQYELLLSEYEATPYDDDVASATEALSSNAAFGSTDRRSGDFIDYCYDDGWGLPNGNSIDGTYTAPSLAPVMAAIDLAAERWSGAMGVQFRHRWDLDGPNCDNRLRWSGEIEFWVTHWSSPSTARGAFPSAGNDFQFLQVPTSGISTALALHELGHILGFRHEHERPEARAGGQYCWNGNLRVNQTPYDAVSVMMYNNCNVSQAIIGLNYLSRLDGVGSRVVYGNPSWWPAMM